MCRVKIPRWNSQSTQNECKVISIKIEIAKKKQKTEERLGWIGLAKAGLEESQLEGNLHRSYNGE